MSGTNGSFYTNGLPISSTETGLGNVPASPLKANPASSSFYLSGSIYQTVQNQDQLLALLTADTALVVADLVASNVAAANAAASAAAAATALATLSASSLQKASNLSDLASVPTALINLGLQNVNNTSDINKPVSTAQATADALVASNAAAAITALSGTTTTSLALKAPLASPALTGVPVAPTAAALNNSTQLATTAYADAATATLSGTVTTALALKAPLASPSLTGVPVAPTASPGTNTTQLATTAFVDAARVILVAVDALKAPLASPALTGTPTAPTASALTNSTQVATTAYADAAVGVEKARGLAAEALLAPLSSPALTGTPTAPTATVGTNTTQLATTAFVLANGAAAGVASVGGQTGALTINGGAMSSAVIPVPRFDAAQSLTTAQQLQTRANIAAAATPAIWTRQVFITAGAFTYTTPTNCKAILVKLRGAGSGSYGSGTTFAAGGAGTASSFGTITAPGASAPTTQAIGATGGVAGVNGDFSIPGESGESANQQITLGDAGMGGGPGGGRAGRPAAGSGDNTAGATNSGAGGGGASSGASVAASAGGGQGAYTEKLIVSPTTSYSGVLGTGGAAGTGTTSPGAKGADGLVIVEEYY